MKVENREEEGWKGNDRACSRFLHQPYVPTHIPYLPYILPIPPLVPAPSSPPSAFQPACGVLPVFRTIRGHSFV